jgi:23S rRNA pseudouridine1911/1915/1917 synthase
MSKPQVNSHDYTQSANAQQPLMLAIPPHLSGTRLDQALAELLPQYSRSRLQAWIAEGAITLDGAAATAKRKVWGGEQVQVAPHAHPSEASPQAEEMALDIVYEDDAILVINKPAGLVVHPGSGNWSGTLMNALLHHAPQLQVVPRAGIVHRLDKETSGLLVVAKTLEAQTDLVRQLQARTVKRHYLAVVEGVVARDGRVEAPIGRHPTARVKMAVVSRGKPAVTHFQVRERFARHTLIECRLETGRTHQIRVHMQSIGYPLVGDPAYGAKHTPRLLSRQALHALRLGLVHPVRQQAMEWETPMPDDLRTLIETLRNTKP